MPIVLADRERCTGCYACVSGCPQGAIVMVDDIDGFWYPRVDMEKCVCCEICYRACPLRHMKFVEDTPQAFACYSTDQAIRAQSSSGGLFTLLAEEVIHDGGVVFGAMFDDGLAVLHSYVESVAELGPLRGSKYVQSRIGVAYGQAKRFLDEGRKVLFSGTPCQVAGLRSYLAQDYGNLECVDVICHGVPSPKVWDRYVRYLESRVGAKLERVRFRCKDRSWKSPSMSFVFRNDVEHSWTIDGDPFMRSFLRNVCLRPSCHACCFKTPHGESDITLGDFWGVQDLLPDMDDDKGTSLLMINSDKGAEMLEGIRIKTILRPVDLDRAVSGNPSAMRSAPRNPNRSRFFKGLDQHSFDEQVNRYCHDGIISEISRKARSVAARILRR